MLQTFPDQKGPNPARGSDLRAGFRKGGPHDHVAVHVDDDAVSRTLVQLHHLAAVHNKILRGGIKRFPEASDHSMRVER